MTRHSKNQKPIEQTQTDSSITEDKNNDLCPIRSSIELTDDNQRHAETICFPVVGIGASAGGLNAFRHFFQAMPANSGIAFVIVQHLYPKHESMMTELLNKYTAMPVVQIEDNMLLESNKVFMIPPDKYLFIKNGRLQLIEPIVRHGMRMPIDFFFRSMAEELKEQAICIILSGTGTDGTLGLRAIKGEGGIALAQEPASAQHTDMPKNAIATGLIDFVLPAEEMPKALLGYLNHSRVWYLHNKALSSETKSDDLQSILSLIHTQTNHDFRCYKKGTLARRIQRRMNLCQTNSYADYFKRLCEDAVEVKSLLRDLLIGVTAFFRDTDAWRELEEQVLIKLLEQKDSSEPIRVWVPGCCTGEEAYSIAILITEIQHKLNKRFTLQIFASDIDEAALDVARAGIYSESIASDVTQERLQQFFIHEEDHYIICKEIRECIVFTQQNFIGDPPFSKLDLICCRNLLIYLEATIQKRIMSLLHFALNEGGYLFLGPSESISQQDNLFESISKKWRIFRRLGTTQNYSVDFPLIQTDKGRQPRNITSLATEPPTRSMTALAHEILLREYAPAAIIVNRKGEALYYYGPVSRYLKVVEGEPTRNITEMVRSGLNLKLRNALHRSIRETAVIKATCQNHDESNALVNITIRPINSATAEGLLLITFEDVKEHLLEAPVFSESISDEIRQLEIELNSTREDLQSTIEQLETSNEELKASNEEVMSMNEELQSTNEELETSKEELHSLNEEMTTVNNQLQDKVQELEDSHNDMVNLFNSTNVATLFLDKQLQIRRFTPTVTRLFRLIPIDVGRHLKDIALRFQNHGLLDKINDVLKNLQPVEQSVISEEGDYFICRILPYRTLDDHIDGVILTFYDVTALRKADFALRTSEGQLKLFIEHAPVALAMFDNNMCYLSASHRWMTDYHLNGQTVTGLSHYDIFPEIPERWREYHRRSLNGEVLREEEDPFERMDGTVQWLRWEIRPWYMEDKVGGIIMVTEDITERKNMDIQLRESDNRFRSFMDNSPAIAWIKDEAGKIIYISGTYEKRFGMQLSKIVGKTDFEIWPPEIAAELRKNDLSVLNTGQTIEVIEQKYGIGDAVYYWDNFKFLLQDDNGRRYVGGIGVDITEKRHIELQLAESLQKIENERDILQSVMNGSKNSHLVYLDTRFNFVRVNNAYAKTCGYRPEDMIGKNYFHLYPSVENAAIFAHVLHTGEAFEAHDKAFTFPNQPERGITYWDWTLAPVQDSSGKMEGLVLALHETTERKLAEEKLYLAARVFDKAGEGIIVTDSNQHIVTVNEAFTHITGYQLEEVIGKTPTFLSSGRHTNAFYAEMWQSINVNGWWQGEIWNHRKNGEIYPEWLTINAVYDANNQLLNYVGIFSDISLVKESQKRIEFLATHDELTGLPNRALFYDHVNHAIEYAKRHDKTFALLFIDLDDFKVINDSLGHDAGDFLLQEIGLRIQNTLRSEDTIARFGGDEFVMIIEDANQQIADITAKRISETIAHPLNLSIKTAYITASIGISLFPHDGMDVDTLLKHADNAMYRAKDFGKATHHFFTGDLEHAADERFQFTNGLRNAIERNELFLVYQPKIDIKTGKLVGLEALLRWQHPDLGLVSPAKFIPIAERNGLIDLIGEWVIHAAFQQLAIWQVAQHDVPRVAINISAQQFRRTHLPTLIGNLLTHYQLRPEQIIIELTESALMSDPDFAMHILTELKIQGIAISIDDFGTGYSSLAYLRRYKLDELKIDKTFIDEIDSNSDDRAIAHTIITMAQTLGLSVVAEGIETNAQLNVLRNLGCQTGQGYLFAKPLHPDEFITQFMQ
jgi:diguanylate cyclase (GGDEF)-like protein/PAS domain S-box-containing protein